MKNAKVKREKAVNSEEYMPRRGRMYVVRTLN
jgi:hypothetical protein